MHMDVLCILDLAKRVCIAEFKGVTGSLAENKGGPSGAPVVPTPLYLEIGVCLYVSDSEADDDFCAHDLY